MSATSLAAWMSLVLVALAILPSVYVLAREALRRRFTKAALAKVAAATSATVGSDELGTVAANLRRDFDNATVERAVEEMLRSEEATKSAVGARLFR